MTHYTHNEWRAQNENNGYPFAEKALLRNDAGRVLLEGTFLDAVLHPIGGKVGLFLSQVVIDHESVTVYVGNTANELLCSGTFNLIDPADTVALVDGFGRPAGLLVSESLRLGMFQSWGTGTHTFTREQTEFAACCCVPQPQIGVRGIQLPDGELFTGEVFLVGDDGVVFRRETIELPGGCGQSPTVHNVIRMDVVGDALFRRRLCQPTNLFQTPRPIQKLLFTTIAQSVECGPDERGNIQITANNALASDSVLRIVNTPDGLLMKAVGSTTGE